MKYVLMYWINYVDKKRGWGSVESPQRVTCPLEGGEGFNWVRFGPRNC